MTLPTVIPPDIKVTSVAFENRFTRRQIKEMKARVLIKDVPFHFYAKTCCEMAA
jgi:hypothetical protein